MVVEFQWKLSNRFIPLDDSTFLYLQSQALITQKSYGVFILKNNFVNMSYKIFRCLSLRQMDSIFKTHKKSNNSNTREVILLIEN